ncbi:MAG: hypothetical protein NTY48_03470 [Candidatus Diapherotrites archaeon]|nr:hypothetical protein [Candidatus Diapherotrites archaeon]
MQKRFLSVFLLLILLMTGLAFAAVEGTTIAGTRIADTNSAAKIVKESPLITIARASLDSSKEVIDRMTASGIPTERVLDIILVARDDFDSAILRASQDLKDPDFTAFNLKMKEFRDTTDLAFGAHDELLALRVRIDKAAKEVPDISSVNDLYDQAAKELSDQRFDRVMALIEKADEKIIDLTSIQTRTEAIYDAAASNMSGFVRTYWIQLALVIGIPVLLFLIFRKRIKQYRLKSKIDALELEVTVLKDEIKRAQEEYFSKGKMPEGTFNIRVSVFGEMIRDLTRDIAMLKEESEKLKSKKLVKSIGLRMKSEGAMRVELNEKNVAIKLKEIENKVRKKK